MPINFLAKPKQSLPKKASVQPFEQNVPDEKSQSHFPSREALEKDEERNLLRLRGGCGCKLFGREKYFNTDIQSPS